MYGSPDLTTRAATLMQIEAYLGRFTAQLSGQFQILRAALAHAFRALPLNWLLIPGPGLVAIERGADTLSLAGFAEGEHRMVDGRSATESQTCTQA